MVQERLGATLTKGALQPLKKEKDSYAASVSHPLKSSKAASDKYGAWGSVYKSKQNFVDMHFS